MVIYFEGFRKLAKFSGDETELFFGSTFNLTICQ